jgi:hypothetical protein
MKRATLLLIALASVLTMPALIGVGPASAMELCDETAEVCEAEDLYSGGTELKAMSSKAVIETSLGNIVCAATLTEETGADAGAPLPGTITKVAFTSCSLKETGCAVTTSASFYHAIDEWAEGDAANFAIFEDGEGDPAVSLKCGAFINCTGSTEELDLAVEGGNPATIEASKEALKVKGVFCPKTASFTAVYEVESPTPLHLDQVVTKLCKVQPQGGTCPNGEEYIAGTIKGDLVTSTNAEFVGAGITITCNEAPIAGTGFQSDGTAGSLDLAFERFSGACNSNFNTNPPVLISVENKPFPRSSFSFGRAGPYLTLANRQNAVLKLKVEEGPPKICTYRLTQFAWAVKAFGPMKVEADLTARLTGGICPNQLNVIGQWIVKRGDGGNLWVTQ